MVRPSYGLIALCAFHLQWSPGLWFHIHCLFMWLKLSSASCCELHEGRRDLLFAHCNRADFPERFWTHSTHVLDIRRSSRTERWGTGSDSGAFSECVSNHNTSSKDSLTSSLALMHSSCSVITHPLLLGGACCSVAFPPLDACLHGWALFSLPHAGLWVSQFWSSYRLSHFLFCPWGSDNASSLLDCGFNEAKSGLFLLIGYLQDSRNNSKVRVYGFWIHWVLASACPGWLWASWMRNNTPTNLTLLAICLLAK